MSVFRHQIDAENTPTQTTDYKNMSEVARQEPHDLLTGKHNQIFRFLALPSELKSLVYREYYVTSEITLTLNEDTDDNSNEHSQTKQGDGPPAHEDPPTLSYRGSPHHAIAIEQVNRELRHEARKVRDAYLSKTLNIEYTRCPQVLNNILPLQALREAPWLTTHISHVRILTARRCHFSDLSWLSLLRPFFYNNLDMLTLEIYETFSKNGKPPLNGDQMSSLVRTRALLGRTVILQRDRLMYSMKGKFRFYPLRAAVRQMIIAKMRTKPDKDGDKELCVEMRYHIDRIHPDPGARYAYQRHQVVVRTTLPRGDSWDVNIRETEGDTESEWCKFPPSAAGRERLAVMGQTLPSH